MKSATIAYMLILVIPIYGLFDKRDIFKTFEEVEKRKEYKAIDDDSHEKIRVLPDRPLHLQGRKAVYDSYIVKSYNLYITDDAIYVVRRSYDYYYKWVFLYESEINNVNVTITNINIDENKSKYLFSIDKSKDGCEIEYGREYSYKEIKGKCSDNSIIEKVINDMTSINRMNIWCERDDCSMERNYEQQYLSQYESLDEISYILNNIRLATYSPGDEFYIKIGENYAAVKENKSLIFYTSESYILAFTRITITVEENYTIYNSSLDKSENYFLCLARDCKYIYNIEEYKYDWIFSLYYTKISNFSSVIDNSLNGLYNNIKNNISINNDIKKSTIKEEKNEEKEYYKEKIKSIKGYYYEEYYNGEYRYSSFYRGYFVIDNILTIIKQEGKRYQSDVQQIKLVIKLDPVTKSTHISNIYDDIVVDQEKSNVEPKNDEGDDMICKSFIPLKEYSTLIRNCTVNMFSFKQEFEDRNYEVTNNVSYTELTINYRKIQMKEYDATKLNEIINRISKNNNPIPDEKCLDYISERITDDNIHLYGREILFNKNFYSSEYITSNGVYNGKTIRFIYGPKVDKQYISRSLFYEYFTSVDYNSGYVNTTGNEYLYLYNHVDLLLNDYIECNKKLVDDYILFLKNKVNIIKKEFGLSDDLPTIKPTSITPTFIPTTPKPIETVTIEIKISNITSSSQSDLSENDKNIMKESIIQIYKEKNIMLKKEDIEIRVENKNILLRRLNNDLHIKVIIKTSEESMKTDVLNIAEELKNNSTILSNEIKKNVDSSSEETIFKDFEIEITKVEDKTNYPTNPVDNDDKDDDNNNELLIGILTGVGIAVVVIFVVLLIVGFILCRSKKSESHPATIKYVS